MRTIILALALALCGLAIPVAGQAEILAMANYESRPGDSLKDLKMPFRAQSMLNTTTENSDFSRTGSS